MAKYAPKFKWDQGDRIVRVVCGMCPDWGSAEGSVALARAHLAAHPTHIVGVVTTTTVLMFIDQATSNVGEVEVTPSGGREHVPG